MTVRERIAQAIHDGPSAQLQYVKAGIDPHTWEDCVYQDQYLADADTVLPILSEHSALLLESAARALRGEFEPLTDRVPDWRAAEQKLLDAAREYREGRR